MRVMLDRLVVEMCQLRPRKSIWLSVLTRRFKCRARCRSSRVEGGQGRVAVRFWARAFSQAALGLRRVVRQPLDSVLGPLGLGTFCAPHWWLLFSKPRFPISVFSRFQRRLWILL